MINIEVYSSSALLRSRRQELLEERYKLDVCNVILTKENTRIRLVMRTSLFKTISGYNPDEIHFKYIPDSDEQYFAHNRLLAKKGKMLILGEQQP